MTEPTISIVIITYNRSHDLLELLQNISHLDDAGRLLKDVVVVNNASTDDYSMVEQLIDKTPDIPFRYIRSALNLGVARGRNYAVNYAHGDLLAFFDDDIVINDRSILLKIKEAFTGNAYGGQAPGVVSFKVLYHSNGEMQQNAFPHKNFQKYKELPAFITYYYAGCAHAFRKEVWQAAGDYPENFFYGMEEYDLAYRVINAGFILAFDGSVKVHHKESPLGRRPKAEQLRMMWVNKTRVAWKYLPLPYFFSTGILWSLEFIIKAGMKWKDYFKGWRAVLAIPFQEKRMTLSDTSLQYLKRVKARLIY